MPDAAQYFDAIVASAEPDERQCFVTRNVRGGTLILLYSTLHEFAYATYGAAVTNPGQARNRVKRLNEELDAARKRREEQAENADSL